MIKFKVPATSANLGPGFDCLGLAFSLSNEFKIKKSDKLVIEGCPKEWTGKDSLLNVAFEATMKKLRKSGSFYCYYKPNIPLSGGLGTSACVIVAGCKIANKLYGGKNKLSDEEIFEIATEIEGHPDNVAPAIYGGLTASIKLDNGKYFCAKYKVSKKLYFTILVPDFSVSTEKARKLLPTTYKKEDAVKTISHSILMVEALRSGNFELLKTVHKDFIHEPYRKKLIKDFDYIKKEVEKDGDAVLLISGSGATLLMISKNKNFSKSLTLNKCKSHWTIRKVEVV